jgi:hypothetical protein
VTTPTLPIQGRGLSKEVEGDVIEVLRGGKKRVDRSISPIAPSRGQVSLGVVVRRGTINPRIHHSRTAHSRPCKRMKTICLLIIAYGRVTPPYGWIPDGMQRCRHPPFLFLFLPRGGDYPGSMDADLITIAYRIWLDVKSESVSQRMRVTHLLNADNTALRRPCIPNRQPRTASGW